MALAPLPKDVEWSTKRPGSECRRERGGRLVAPRGDRVATDRAGGHEQGMVPYAVGLSTAERTCSESLASVRNGGAAVSKQIDGRGDGAVDVGVAPHVLRSNHDATCSAWWGDGEDEGDGEGDGEGDDAGEAHAQGPLAPQQTVRCAVEARRLTLDGGVSVSRYSKLPGVSPRGPPAFPGFQARRDASDRHLEPSRSRNPDPAKADGDLHSLAQASLSASEPSQSIKDAC
ncbi:hypothetical protein P171DRAFT_447618 [Karstenula rhodostoma CBS 690.94]|uniref:Uncharacterized protein n=1 Tax=Karstenula rhodostoma CBS 690.94 TaxID=1392251 RepID=A0A9P4PAZ0_9PLEO|nr:hypothetical protein P171DRAFT_447618 [Karstenula rhodostoma CBS 690.94]